MFSDLRRTASRAFARQNPLRRILSLGLLYHRFFAMSTVSDKNDFFAYGVLQISLKINFIKLNY